MTRPIPFIRSIASVTALAALGAAAGSVPAAEGSDAPVAHWEQRTLDYTYMGFTTHYSCDGLEDNVRELLLALGARKKDLEIHSVGCTRLVGIEPFPGVKAHFWVLVPGPGDAKTTVQATKWQSVNLVRQINFRSDQGQCELLDQLKHKALPLFTSRNLDFHSSCVPHEITLGDIHFTVEVLRPAGPTPPA